jgi:hypothetical protein
VPDRPDDPSPHPETPSRTRRSGGEAADSSKGSAASSPFVADAGAFDPDAPAAEPSPAAGGAELHALPTLLPEWEEQSVRSVLTAKGAALHTLIAVDKESDEWRYTETDLNAIAPPLTRILNRYDATRAAAGTADEIALIVGLSGYVGRSVRTRREDAARLTAAEPEPVSGVVTEPIPVPPAGDAPVASPVGDFEPPTAPGK